MTSNAKRKILSSSAILFNTGKRLTRPQSSLSARRGRRARGGIDEERETRDRGKKRGDGKEEKEKKKRRRLPSFLLLITPRPRFAR